MNACLLEEKLTFFFMSDATKRQCLTELFSQFYAKTIREVCKRCCTARFYAARLSVCDVNVDGMRLKGVLVKQGEVSGYLVTSTLTRVQQ